MSHRSALAPSATQKSMPTSSPSWIQRHPLLAFFAWFFTVGQAFAFFPVVMANRGVEVPHQPFILGSTLVGLLLPALVITRVVDGPEGLRALLRRAVEVRVSAGWYAFALLLVPVLSVGLSVGLLGRPTDLSPSIIGSTLLSSFLLQILLNLVPNNWTEEVAWSGFVQRRFQDRHSPFQAALLAGPLFALQHVSAVAGATLGEAVFLMMVMALLVTPYRFVTGWVYNRTGSLLLVGLLHAAGNAAATGSGFMPGLLRSLYPESQLAGMAHLLVFALVGIVVVIATRGRLGLDSAARAQPRSVDERGLELG